MSSGGIEPGTSSHFISLKWGAYCGSNQRVPACSRNGYMDGQINPMWAGEGGKER